MNRIERLAEEWWVKNRSEVFSQTEAYLAGYKQALRDTRLVYSPHHDCDCWNAIRDLDEGE